MAPPLVAAGMRGHGLRARRPACHWSSDASSAVHLFSILTAPQAASGRGRSPAAPQLFDDRIGFAIASPKHGPHALSGADRSRRGSHGGNCSMTFVSFEFVVLFVVFLALYLVLPHNL